MENQVFCPSGLVMFDLDGLPKSNQFTQVYSSSYTLVGSFNSNNGRLKPFKRCKMQLKYLKI